MFDGNPVSSDLQELIDELATGQQYCSFVRGEDWRLEDDEDEFEVRRL